MLYVQYTVQPLTCENVVIISAQIPRVLFEVCACKVLLSKYKFLTTVFTDLALRVIMQCSVECFYLQFCLQCRHSLNVQKILFPNFLGLH